MLKIGNDILFTDIILRIQNRFVYRNIFIQTYSTGSITEKFRNMVAELAKPMQVRT